MKSKTNRIAVIGDLIGSRSLPDRRNVQQQLQHALMEVNSAYAEIIESKFTLTLGDEFQGIVRPDPRVFALLDTLESRLPWDFRVGLGYGEILTSIDPELSIGADGPAYWRAREAIDHVHDKNWNGKNRIRICGFGADKDALLNALFVTTDALKASWTRLQRDTFSAMLARGIYRTEFDQQSFAEELGISASALTRRLNAGNIKIYLHGRTTAGESIEAWRDSDA